MQYYIDIDLIVAVLAGLVTAIPLVYKLIQYVKLAAKNGEWGDIVDLVVMYMKDAEQLFEDGTSRKDYVMTKIAESADVIDYPIDMVVIGELIDKLCDMAKVVNNNHKEHIEVMNAGE